MIRINKPPQAPDDLLQESGAATEALQRQYDRGTRYFTFDNDIYREVKDTLRQMQHGKCCYCERKLETGDVEHFRPKAGYKQNNTDELHRPGYYWLVYDWDNLLFSCAECNRYYKKNFFPLDDETQRARSHHDDIRNEVPLLVHPAREDPQAYIEFIATQPRAVQGCRKGRLTIQYTGMDRPFLNESRFKIYQVFKTIFRVLQNPSLDEQEKDSLQQLLNDAARDNAEFAAMIRCAIRDNFRF
ncbi:MAG: hypothetical protein GY862_24900 [Gammaproteobacteria bacterium]|nr:hypothetical protein [Gammaproteobacteria bacterium]